MKMDQAMRTTAQSMSFALSKRKIETYTESSVRIGNNITARALFFLLLVLAGALSVIVKYMLKLRFSEVL